MQIEGVDQNIISHKDQAAISTALTDLMRKHKVRFSDSSKPTFEDGVRLGETGQFTDPTVSFFVEGAPNNVENFMKALGSSVSEIPINGNRETEATITKGFRLNLLDIQAVIKQLTNNEITP